MISASGRVRSPRAVAPSARSARSRTRRSCASSRRTAPRERHRPLARHHRSRSAGAAAGPGTGASAQPTTRRDDRHTTPPRPHQAGEIRTGPRAGRSVHRWTGSRCQGLCAQPRTRRCQADVEAPWLRVVDGRALVGEDGRVPIGDTGDHQARGRMERARQAAKWSCRRSTHPALAIHRHEVVEAPHAGEADVLGEPGTARTTSSKGIPLLGRCRVRTPSPDSRRTEARRVSN